MSRIALFVDYENIHISLNNEYHFALDVEKLIPLIKERIEEHGEILVQKAYADWEDYPQVQSKLDRLGITPQYVLSKKISRKERDGNIRVVSRKNSSDIAMALDIQQMLYERAEIDLFVLVTGDRDFIVPIRRLRGQQKGVIVFGVKQTTSGDLLDVLPGQGSFISIESLLGIEAVYRPKTSDYSSPDFDWIPFVSRMDELEKHLPFVALKYLRDTILTESLGCGFSVDSKTRFLNEAITRGILQTDKVPNPNRHDTFTTTCKLNRNHPLVREISA